MLNGIRLHREALKQSATDPLSGKIDVGILTTGLTSAARKRRIELAKAVKDLIESKGKVPTINYQKLLAELKETSNTVRQFNSRVMVCDSNQLLIIDDNKGTVRGCSKRSAG